MLKYKEKMTPRERNQLIRDSIKYLNIDKKLFDKRTKAHLELINKYGGYEGFYNHLSTELNKIDNYKKTIKNRVRQLEVQKRYIQRKKEPIQEYIGNIQATYLITYRDDAMTEDEKKIKSMLLSNYKEMKRNIDYKTTNLKEKDIEGKRLFITTINIKFKEYIKKNDIEKTVNIKVEQKRLEIFKGDNYIDEIKTINTYYEINDFKQGTKYQDIKLKDTVYNLEGCNPEEWNTNRGMCVIDYIKWYYRNSKGLIKACKEEALIELFGGYDKIKDGITSQEIYLKFCMKYDVSFYAFNENDDCFLYRHKQNTKTNYPALMFKILNNHFYPIPDNDRLSLCKTVSNLKNTSDIYIKPKTEEVIKHPKEYNILENVDALEEMGRLMKGLKIIPKVSMYEDEIVSFTIDKKHYVVNQQVEFTKELCNNLNIEYNNQSLGNILNIIIGDFVKSSCNPYIYNHLIEAKKNRTHHGLIDEKYKRYLNNYNTRAFDINKCYSSVINKPLENWMTFDFNDNWEDYNEGDEIQLGLYQVKTEDITLFKGSNIYSSSIIKKAIEENIKFSIEKKMICKNEFTKELFKPIIQRVKEACHGDMSKMKILLNRITGKLAKHKNKVSSCKINNCLEQIYHTLRNYEDMGLKDVFIMNIPNTEYKIYGYDEDIILNENNIPMYIQILDQSNIKLYDMIKTFGGKLIGRKTDCAVIYFKDKKDIPPNEYFEDKEWGSYRYCHIPKITHTDIIIHKYYDDDREWNIYNIEDSDEWEKIYDIFNEGEGLLLNGGPGRGKSFVCKKITYKIGKDRVKIIAPTNKSAINVGGTTIHKFLKLDINGKINKKVIEKVKKNYDCIIIDEISMITKELWKRLVLLKKATGIKFLLLGDENQLPPVEDEDIDDYFNHSAVKYLANYNKNTLKVCKRFDEKLNRLLDNVEKLNVNDFGSDENVINICYYNETRKYVNSYWNNKLKPDNCLLIKEDIEDEYTQDMYIYEGLPIISRKTIEGGDVCYNNETFTVDTYDDDCVYISTARPDEDGNEYPHGLDIKINDFNKLFCMNYAMTTHKSQGSTINEKFTIWDWDKMNKKCKYTALSRATKAENVSFKFYKKVYKNNV